MLSGRGAGAERWGQLLLFVDTTAPMEQKQHSSPPFSHLDSYMKMHKEPGWEKNTVQRWLAKAEVVSIPILSIKFSLT